jgi:hypothetical protein
MATVTLKPDRLFNLQMDWTFKAVFTRNTPESRGACKRLLEANLHRKIDQLSVIANEPPPNSGTDRQIRYDFACTFCDGEQANVEMTLWPEKTEPWRMEWFLHRLHTSQNIKGDPDFANLRRTYQISFWGHGRYHDSHPFHRFSYHDSEHGTDFGGLTNLYVVELEKVAELAGKPSEDLRSEECWGLFLRFYHEREKRGLIDKLVEREEGIAMAVQVMNGFSEEQAEAIRQMSHDKYIMDMNQAKHDLRDIQAEYERTMNQLDQTKGQLDQKDRTIAELQAEIARLKGK